ncbi:MAG: hypothetical protein M3Y49_13045 [Actinomycetota bacterium]|nr:hypothetical protein [Actinomycetota bacterium]
MAEEEPGNHGNSIAAWTMVAILILGSLLLAFGVAFGRHSLDIAGVVIGALGVATGEILSKAGFGAPALRAPGDQEDRQASPQAQTGVQ